MLATAGLLLGLLATPLRSWAQFGPRPPVPAVFDTVYAAHPARLVYFIAWEYYGGGQVDWVTTEEDALDTFEVQQSLDKLNWQVVGTMDAHAGSREQRWYTLYDSNIRRYGAPVIYYRLRLPGAHGRSTYSPVRIVRLHNPDMPWRTAAAAPLPR